MRHQFGYAALATLLIVGCSGGASSSTPNVVPNVSSTSTVTPTPASSTKVTLPTVSPNVMPIASALPSATQTALIVTQPTFKPVTVNIPVPQVTPMFLQQFATTVIIPGFGTLDLALPTANVATTITATVYDQLPQNENIPSIATSTYPGTVVADIAFQVSQSAIFDGNYQVEFTPISPYYASLGDYYIVELYYPGIQNWIIPPFGGEQIDTATGKISVNVYTLGQALNQGVTLHAAIVHTLENPYDPNRDRASTTTL